jgi:HEAT repeat protein
MAVGLEKTFSVLSKTDNATAVRVLLPALDSTRATIQEGALAALLQRRTPAGQDEIIRRIPTLGQRWKQIIHQHPGRLTAAMREAMLGPDESQYANACAAALMFGDFDLIPTLLIMLEDQSQEKAELAAQTMLQLATQLYEQLAHPDESSSRDLQWVQQHVVSCLETSMHRYGKHKRREAVDAFLMLAKPDSPAISQILANPHHVGHMVLINALARSPHDGIIRLLLDFFEDPDAPLPMLNVSANRCDIKFIRSLLHKVDRNASEAVLQNLKRMGNIAWLQNGAKIAADLDDEAQRSLVFFVMSLGIARPRVFSTIEYLLQRGKPGGRREAARALNAFNGPDANRLALTALGDSDPQVQANVIPHLRRRGIPGVLQRILLLLDSPHLVVRQAARRALGEFSFTRYLGTFDMLDSDARKTTAAIVKKIDQHTIRLLREELSAPTGSRRLRGLQIVQAMEVAPLVEENLIEMLGDEEDSVRAEAADALGACRSPAARAALEQAVHDHILAVREAATNSLKAMTT